MKRSGSTASVQAVAPVEIAQRNDPLHGHFVCLRWADVEVGGACCVSECTDGEQGTGEREEDLRYAAPSPTLPRFAGEGVISLPRLRGRARVGADRAQHFRNP